jgi:hypothetical protein
MLSNRSLRTAVLACAIAAGIWSGRPPVAFAGGGPCAFEGCCLYTVNCGSPSQWRCCEPSGSEAKCESEECPNYCYQGGCPS